MSATASKKQKHNQPALATTGRGAALYITLGIFFLTLGAAWLISLIISQESYVIQQLFLMLMGLCGPLCPAMPALLIWGGAKLMVSSRHRVSVRNFVIVFSVYLLILAGYTLIARVPQGTGAAIPYLDYVKHQAESAGLGAKADFSSCLNQAYFQRSSGAGGLVGMMIAYPLASVLSRFGAMLLVAALLVTLILILFRVNPGDLFRSASDFGEKQRMRVARKQREARNEQPAPIPQAAPVRGQPAQNTYGQPAPSVQYQAAPVYQAQPAATPAQSQNGFYPVQPDLYEESFPSASMEQPAWRREDISKPESNSPAQNKPEKAAAAGSWISRLKKKDPEDGKPDTPSRQSFQQKTIDAKDAAPSAAPILTQALDEEDDDLPWYTPLEVKQGKAPATHASIPVPSVATASLPTKMDAAVSSSERKDAPSASGAASAAPSWASQVSQRKAELDLPEHTTGKGEPKPVYTDPVMPITGEKTAISPRKSLAEPSSNTRVDGTSAPIVKQGSMGMSIPYQAPPIRLLREGVHVDQADAAHEDERRAQIIEGTLRSFGVESEVKQIMHGPSITRFAIQIAPGVKVSRVSNTADNLALELKTKNVRVEAPIQGTNYIGIEVPNQLVSTVALREVLESPEMQNNPSPLLVALGKDVAGAPILCDLSKMPHLLIAGATGSGKSVCINSIICSLLYRTSPDQVRLIMVDPKQVELSIYNAIPHLLVPVVSDPRKAAGALAWVVQEMLERYGKFSAQNVRNLAGYNKANQGTDQVLPNIVVIIDEMADLMEVCRKDVEESIRRLAALARAAGIYMVLATQRPSVDVITGVIKNNIPSRIAFAVSSGIDSRTIIDIIGAEKLMGKGDMLYKPAGTSALRVQGCLVTDEEVRAVTDYISSRYQTDYDPNIVEHLESSGNEHTADEIGGPDEDSVSADGGDGSFMDLLQKAIEMAVEDGQTSVSMVQRRLRVGYARAGRLIDEMEKRGIISQSEGSKPRKTLITREQYYEMMQDH